MLVEDGGAATLIAKDKCGWTALHYASRFHVTIVKHLIKMGAATDHGNGTPLHTALMPRTSASTGYSPVIEIVKCLLEAGVDASKVDRFGRTALHVAVSGGLSGSCVEILKVLARSVDVNAVDKSGQTALHAAVSQADPQSSVVNFLLRAGVDVNATDKKGRRAADLAVHSPHILKELDRSQSSSLPVTAARFHRRLCEVCRPPPSSSEGGSLPPKDYESEGLWGLPHAGTGSAWKEMLELLDSTSSLNMSPSTESLIRSSCAAAASSSRSLDSSLSDLIKEGRRAQKCVRSAQLTLRTFTDFQASVKHRVEAANAEWCVGPGGESGERADYGASPVSQMDTGERDRARVNAAKAIDDARRTGFVAAEKLRRITFSRKHVEDISLQSLVARLKRVVVIEIESSTPLADISPLLSSLTLEDLCKKATNLGNGWVKQRSAKMKLISDATESSWARATAAFSEMRTGNCWSFQDACARLERAETAKATLLGKMRGLEDSYS